LRNVSASPSAYPNRNEIAPHEVARLAQISMCIKTIGITGGSGFLGGALARRLTGKYQVRILDRVRPDFLNSHPSLGYRECDVTSKEECLAAVEGLDAVFHRAGLMGNLASMTDPMRYYSVNLLGTLNMLEACAFHKVSRFIFDSTEAVYGRNHAGPITEQARPEPNSIYGATKLAAEAAVKMYDEHRGLSTLIFRYSRTRTSRKEDAITILARKVLKGEPVTLYDGGEPMIDFVELDDLIEANVRALTSSLRGEVVNLCSGQGISFAGILAAIEKSSGQRAVLVRFEQVPDRPPGSEHKFGSKTFFMSPEKANRCLGWQPAWSVEDSIAASIKSLRKGDA
jgi:UDP-glucose 4-epimerase